MDAPYFRFSVIVPPVGYPCVCIWAEVRSMAQDINNHMHVDALDSAAIESGAAGVTPHGREAELGALYREIEPRATEAVLDLRLDNAVDALLAGISPADLAHAPPFTLCYAAMEQSTRRGDYPTALELAQAAIEQFERRGDGAGYARATAEAGIARYHLGQHATALLELQRCPIPWDPSCAAALCLALCLNHLGADALPEAVRAATRGLEASEHEPNLPRRANWRMSLQRNLVAAYHFQGELDAARRAVRDTARLAARYETGEGIPAWCLYEWGLLEQRAGRFPLALKLLARARARVEQQGRHEALWRWIVAAEGHTLRDMGMLDAADARYHQSGWGEGDDGPLLLWLLQGRQMEARCAAEARLAAARAAGSPVEATNVAVILALLDLEGGATAAVGTTLRNAAERYAKLGFYPNQASVQFHLAAVEYALGDDAAGDEALRGALSFGARQGYRNFTWWHPERMLLLLRRAIAAGIETEYSRALLRERELDRRADRDAPNDGRVVPAGPAGLSNSAARTLRLQCLGSFEVWVDEAPLPRERWQGQGAGAVRMQRLLLYLARQRAPQPIAAIARYVWPDIWERIDVRDNFHLTLAGLRRVFEPEIERGQTSRFVLTTPEGFQLHPALRVTVDLDQFEVYLHRARVADAIGDREAARTAFEQVETLYAGDFTLAKPDPDEADGYCRAASAALCWLVADDLDRGAFSAAATRARRVLREDRWNADAPVLLIEAHLALGDRRAARRQYERYLQLHGEASAGLARLAREQRL
jgi:DNA-binding SARP family transcriptional activator